MAAQQLGSSTGDVGCHQLRTWLLDLWHEEREAPSRCHTLPHCHTFGTNASHRFSQHLTTMAMNWLFSACLCVIFVCHCVCLGLKNVEDIYLIRSHQHCHQIASRCCGTLWASGDIWCIWWRNGMCRRLGASATTTARTAASPLPDLASSLVTWPNDQSNDHQDGSTTWLTFLSF